MQACSRARARGLRALCARTCARCPPSREAWTDCIRRAMLRRAPGLRMLTQAVHAQRQGVGRIVGCASGAGCPRIAARVHVVLPLSRAGARRTTSSWRSRRPRRSAATKRRCEPRRCRRRYAARSCSTRHFSRIRGPSCRLLSHPPAPKGRDPPTSAVSRHDYAGMPRTRDRSLSFSR